MKTESVKPLKYLLGNPSKLGTMVFMSLLKVSWYFVFVAIPALLFSPQSWSTKSLVAIFILVLVTVIHFTSGLISLVWRMRKDDEFGFQILKSDDNEFIKLLEQLTPY